MTQTLPTVVIVGRPNVGKSTLFNRITGQRRAIVGDEPGITRDRLHGLTDYHGRRFELIDTGGIVVDDSEYIPSQILKQARFALERAAHIIFLVDGRAEITTRDRDLARLLLRLGHPISLAVNKADTGARENLAHDFYSLGISDIFPYPRNTASAWMPWWIVGTDDPQQPGGATRSMHPACRPREVLLPGCWPSRVNVSTV